MKALLDLLFEGHEIRVVSNGEVLFVAADVCAALELSKSRDAITRLDVDEKTSVRLAGIPSTTTGRNSRGNPNVAAVTQSGLYHLILLSRKPVAKRFRKWITSEVLPQIAKYGTWIPGATPKERCSALWKRWKQERAELLSRDESALAESGLLTVAAFRVVHAIPARDGLSFARQVQFQAARAGIRPRRFFQRGGMRSAWPAAVLTAALGNFQPRLDLGFQEKTAQ
jgi:prophage antirepressor-like protein